MKKITKEQIMKAISNLKVTASSCEHQAMCIEAETSTEDDDEFETSDGTVVTGLGDMWDSNDSGNWTSMEANINDAIKILEEILLE